MLIKIIAVGKVKEKFLTDGINEYLKRISGYTKIEILEVDDYQIHNENSSSEIEQVKNKECSNILKVLKPTDYVVLLDLNKKQLSSPEFANFISEKMVQGGSKITFVIGGSYGLSDEMKKRGNYSLTLSNMTFTHQLTRLILLEQIFRAYKILNNETYHK